MPPKPHRSWFRSSVWILPVIVCVVFVALIAGALTVRQVIVRISRTRPESSAETPVPAKSEAAAPLASLPVVKETVQTPPDPVVKEEPYDPAELQPLPPPAAHTPGRRLPRRLLVGDSPEMFSNVNEALSACVPGDVIEIRTNRPQAVAPVFVEPAKDVRLRPLILQAGVGFTPVIQVPLGSWLQLRDIPLVVEGVHFVAGEESGEAVVIQTNASTRVVRCTQTGMGNLSSGWKVLVHFQRRGSEAKDQPPVQIEIEDCFFRNAFVVCRCHDAALRLVVRNCLGVNGHCVIACKTGPLKPLPGLMRELQLERNTFLKMSKLIDVPLGTDDWSDIRHCPLTVDCSGNLILARELIGVGVADFAPANWAPVLKQGAVRWRGEENIARMERLAGLWSARPNVPNPFQLAAKDMPTWNQLWAENTELRLRFSPAVLSREFNDPTPVTGNPEQFAPIITSYFPDGVPPGIGSDLTRLPQRN